MSALPKNVLYYGREEAPPEQVPLRAGPLSMVFEEGALRYVRLGDREVLRGIYAAVRDHNWDTVPAALSDVRIDARDDSFDVSFTADHRQGEVHFTWAGTITGDSAGTVRFVFEGRAPTTFRRNRIGFCVLHPARECAGARCRVVHADRTVEESEFPRFISPHQPFLDIKSISHEVADGLWAEVTLEGDVFEMEDQRNWTDASFKTYCTPLRLPFPVKVEAGQKVRQRVTLALRGRGPQAVPLPRGGDDAVPVRFIAPPEFSSRPVLRPVGLGMASHGRALTAREVARLRGLALSHLRADLSLHRPDWRAVLSRATGESAEVGVPLELAVIVSDDAERELHDLAAAARDLRSNVRTWLVFHKHPKSTDVKWAALARRILPSASSGTSFGGGTNAYFTELNRARPDAGVLDVVNYSINPQVHAFDNATLVETLEAQAVTVDGARAFCGRTPVSVSPVTLKPRFNPDATGPDPDPTPGTLPKHVDVRQMSLFGAGWTLGSLKYLAEAGADSVTFYETTGWRGVMEEEAGCPAPNLFRSLPGAVFPMYHVLADVAEFAGADVIQTRSDDTLAVEVLALIKGGRTRVMLANLGPRPRKVALGVAGKWTVRTLDETTAIEAMTRPEEFRRRPGETVRGGAGGLVVELRPFAVARVDHGE